jgi:hypothetical protein
VIYAALRFTEEKAISALIRWLIISYARRRAARRNGGRFGDGISKMPAQG